jgi:PAS domain S-box-containing protein
MITPGRKQKAVARPKFVSLQNDVEVRLASVVASSPCAIFALNRKSDGSCCLPYSAPSIEDLFSVTPLDLQTDGSVLFGRVHDEDRPLLLHTLEQSAADLSPWRAEFRLRHHYRGELWVEVHSQPQREPDGSIIWNGYFADVTGRKMAQAALQEVQASHQAEELAQRQKIEEALRVHETRLASVQRLARLGTWEFAITNLSPVTLTPLAWSEELFHLFGYDPQQTQVSNENFLAAIHEEDRLRIQNTIGESIEGRHAWEAEHRVTWPDGSERIVLQRGELLCDDQGTPLRMIGTAQDVTDRRQAEATLQSSDVQLTESQKLEALGQLAGGIAHDFNNLLTTIQRNAVMLNQLPGKTNESAELVREITDSSRRAGTLIRQLLAFSRQQSMKAQRLDINEVTADLYKRLYRLLGDRISLQCNYASNLPAIEADSAMLEQVILNLALNARDAMPQGGNLKLATHCEDIDRAAASRNPEAREGRFVVLTVADTGKGMDSKTLSRLFEPFFTTKDPGEGSGMGLATVYGIMKQHNGWIEVASRLREGTIFKLFFPAVATPKRQPPGARRIPNSKP